MEFVKPNKALAKDTVAFISSRKGGQSSGDFSSFNLAFHVDDSQSDVMQNRKMLTHYLQTQTKEPVRLVWLNQVHSADVLVVDHDYLHSKQASNRPLTDADAIYTNLRGVACCIMTADCLPILVSSSTSDEVAAIHAGWKGLAAGVIEKTIAHFACKPSDLSVWVGPSLTLDNFEVGKEVANVFCDYPQAIQAKHDSNKFMVSMSKIAAIKLSNMGITNIQISKYCTYDNEDMFYSHRRSTHQGQESCGRMVSVVYKKQ